MTARNILRPGSVRQVLCAVLALAMAAGPSLNVWAQTDTKVPSSLAQPAQPKLTLPPATGTIDTTYLTPGTAGLVVVRPAQIMRSPMSELLPTEVASAAGLKFLGVDPADVEEIRASADPTNPTVPNYCITVKFVKPLPGFKIKDEFKAHTEPAQLAGKPYLKSKQPEMPGFFTPDQQSFLIAPDVTLQQLVAHPNPHKSGPIIDRVGKVAAGDDLYVALDIATVRPFLQLGLMQAQSAIPPDARPLLDAVNLISAAELKLNLSRPAPSSLVVHANDEAAAIQIEDLVKQAADKAREKMRADLEPQMQSPDPVQRAFAQYMERVSGRWSEPLLPKRDGAKLTIFRIEAATGPQAQYTNIAITGILVALLLPAVQAAREAARRNKSMNNMKEIDLALLNYDDSKKAFPAHAIYSADGKPLLSWRVAILPYIDQQALYEEFHLDEPWDSPHNKALIARMPSTYANPNMPGADGRTNYLAIVGKECVFDGTEKGRTVREISDGSSKTITIVEADADRAVEWTKPYDLNFDATNPKAGLGHVHPGAWLAAFCDGHVEVIGNGMAADTVKAMFTCAGGERY